MSSGRKCNNCGSADIEVDNARGDAVCTNCGSVLEDNIIVSEIQFEENAHGAASAVGQFVASDSRGGATAYGKFHVGTGTESREVTLRKARQGITLLCSQLRLNNHCIETACNFFKMALMRNLTRGRRNTHIYAACVYITCRTEGTSHLLIDISDVLQICCYELGRTYLKLSQSLCLNIPSIADSPLLASNICTEPTDGCSQFGKLTSWFVLLAVAAAVVSPLSLPFPYGAVFDRSLLALADEELPLLAPISSIPLLPPCAEVEDDVVVVDGTLLPLPPALLLVCFPTTLSLPPGEWPPEPYATQPLQLNLYIVIGRPGRRTVQPKPDNEDALVDGKLYRIAAAPIAPLIATYAELRDPVRELFERHRRDAYQVQGLAEQLPLVGRGRFDVHFGTGSVCPAECRLEQMDLLAVERFAREDRFERFQIDVDETVRFDGHFRLRSENGE
uniref:TFIIB-type domain-containing protein n=1 Tax=Anopheles culicifacies TaxID=139723 RepID=A0A182MFW1_9DIPT